MALESINPIDGTLIRSYDEMSETEVDRRIAAARQASVTWSRTTFAERSSLLQATAERLRARKPELATLMTDEMGKLLREAEAEIDKCIWACDHYAEHGEAYLAREHIKTEATSSFVDFRPLGVVLAVMPWNFPFWQVFRFAAPAVMAGNTALLKHAGNVQSCGLAIEELFTEAGALPGLFSTLVVPGRRVPDIIADRRVAAVTLTGSTEAGRSVGAAAGKAIKPSVLELGGSDAYVVLEDADLELAAQTCVTSRLINGGQSCIAAKRFIAVDSIADELERLVADRMRAIKMGDPRAPQTDLGPMAREDLRDELHDQVKRSVAAGAHLMVGGTIPDGPGVFYPATVLTGVTSGMAAYEEELFGPVAVVIHALDEEDAIRIANDSVFGLGAAVFTQDLARGERIASEEIEAGYVAVNTFVKSDPRLPFGGIKESGYGRELSDFGIREFVNVKTVVVS